MNTKNNIINWYKARTQEVVHKIPDDPYLESAYDNLCLLTNKFTCTTTMRYRGHAFEFHTRPNYIKALKYYNHGYLKGDNWCVTDLARCYYKLATQNNILNSSNILTIIKNLYNNITHRYIRKAIKFNILAIKNNLNKSITRLFSICKIYEKANLRKLFFERVKKYDSDGDIILRLGQKFHKNNLATAYEYYQEADKLDNFKAMLNIATYWHDCEDYPKALISLLKYQNYQDYLDYQDYQDLPEIILLINKILAKYYDYSFAKNHMNLLDEPNLKYYKFRIDPTECIICYDLFDKITVLPECHCSKSPLICATCFPKLTKCPICRFFYPKS